MKKPSFILLLVVLGLSVACVNKEEHRAKLSKEIKSESIVSMKKEEETLKKIVQNFYDALSTTPEDDVAGSVAGWMDAKWKSTPTPPGGPDMEGYVKTLFMFHGMIPDLKWDVQEMLVDGNRVIVRSTASGTPNSPEGYFFGTPTNGEKSFEVMTIDIHNVVDGKIVSSYHVEDWLTAVQQVAPTKE